MLRLLAAVSLASCTFAHPEDVTYSQTSMTIASGNDQEGFAGGLLAEPLIVNVTDADLRPLSNFSVAFTILEGGGGLSEEIVRTDAQGNARTELTLGARVGRNLVQATGEGLVDEPAVFQALGLVGPVAEIVKVAGDGADVVVASTVALAVRVEDQHENPVPGVVVELAAEAGDALSVTTATTPDSGEVASTLTLGTAARARTVTVTAGGLTTTFAIGGRAGAPTQITIQSGDDAIGRALEPLPPFVARVGDQHGNPVAGVAVDFVRTLGLGTLDVASATTAGDGRVQTIVTPSNLGEINRVEARVTGLAPAVFDATTRSFRAPTTAGAFACTSFDVANIGGDSRPDVVGRCTRPIGNNGASEDLIAFMVNTGASTSFQVFVVQDNDAAAVADVDQNGSVDLVDGSSSTSIRVRLDGSGSSQTVVSGADITDIARIALGDLDGDGLPDLVFHAELSGDGVSGEVVCVARNTTTGGVPSFAPRQCLGAATSNETIAIGDLDGDGKADLVVGTQPVRVFRNTTVGNAIGFAVPLTINGPSEQTMIADVDGDGKPDLVRRNGTSVAIDRNITAGSLQFAAGSAFSSGAAAGDLNGDGRADLVSRTQGPAFESTTVLVSLSASSTSIAFTGETSIAVGASSFFAVGVVDLNNDGRADLVLHSVSAGGTIVEVRLAE